MRDDSDADLPPRAQLGPVASVFVMLLRITSVILWAVTFAGASCIGCASFIGGTATPDQHTAQAAVSIVALLAGFVAAFALQSIALAVEKLMRPGG